MQSGPHALSDVTYALMIVLTILGMLVRRREQQSGLPTASYCIMVGTLSLPVIIFSLGLVISGLQSMTFCVCTTLTPEDWATDRDMAVLSITSLSFLLADPRLRKVLLAGVVFLLYFSLLAN